MISTTETTAGETITVIETAETASHLIDGLLATTETEIETAAGGQPPATAAVTTETTEMIVEEEVEAAAAAHPTPEIEVATEKSAKRSPPKRINPNQRRPTSKTTKLPRRTPFVPSSA